LSACPMAYPVGGSVGVLVLVVKVGNRDGRISY
jgi:hypothetical protein